jgi:hypothetical protein
MGVNTSLAAGCDHAVHAISTRPVPINSSLAGT